ncbi:hypothetical protein L917_19104, partial [Phytophthora nicotianae]
MEVRRRRRRRNKADHYVLEYELQPARQDQRTLGDAERAWVSAAGVAGPDDDRMHEWYGPCQLDTGHTHGDNGACEGDVRHGRCPNGIEVQYVRPTHHGESSVRSA